MSATATHAREVRPPSRAFREPPARPMFGIAGIRPCEKPPTPRCFSCGNATLDDRGPNFGVPVSHLLRCTCGLLLQWWPELLRIADASIVAQLGPSFVPLAHAIPIERLYTSYVAVPNDDGELVTVWEPAPDWPPMSRNTAFAEVVGVLARVGFYLDLVEGRGIQPSTTIDPAFLAALNERLDRVHARMVARAQEEP